MGTGAHGSRVPGAALVACAPQFSAAERRRTLGMDASRRPRAARPGHSAAAVPARSLPADPRVCSLRLGCGARASIAVGARLAATAYAGECRRRLRAAWITPFQLAGRAGLEPRAPRDVLAAGEPSLRNRMRELASQPARRRQHLLSAYPELPVFMPQRVTPNRTLLDAAPAPFQVLLEREHIDLVWLDEELRLAPRFRGGSGLPTLHRAAGALWVQRAQH